jgi:drug/metabolite transporter (DMT)-like permease
MLSAGILLALASAAVWGAGDFAGGVATKRSHQFQVLALSALSGILLLGMLAMWLETLPSMATVRWAAAAGLAGAIGIASLYRGLAIGQAAIVAPVAAVMTAVLPVIAAALNVGLPRPSVMLGFALALAGIWLVTRTPVTDGARATGIGIAVAAGTGFGGFLILIGYVGRDSVFVPLAVARAVMLATGIVLMLIRGVPLPSVTSNRVALLAGVLDAAGNILYVLARQHTRPDVAAVLSSLYPISTVALAHTVSHEQVRAAQWIGIATCLAAVALIAR